MGITKASAPGARIEDATLSKALDAAARALAEKLVKEQCPVTDAEDWAARQQLWAMTDGLVSIRTISGDGTAKGSGSTSVVWDTRSRPFRTVKLTDGALAPKDLERAVGAQAFAFLKKHDALASAQLDPEAKTAPMPEAWAATADGVQLFFGMSSWAASGDGTVYALVPRERPAPLYRPESALGTWARATHGS